MADKQNMNLRNILDIITEGSKEVNSDLPRIDEYTQGISDLTKSQLPFLAQSTPTAKGDIDGFEVQTLPQFLKGHGVVPRPYEEVIQQLKSKEEELPMAAENVDPKNKVTNIDRSKDNDGINARYRPYNMDKDRYEKCRYCNDVPNNKDCPGCEGFGFVRRAGYRLKDMIDEALDAPTRPFTDLTQYLDRTVNKKKLKTDKYKNPYIHRSNIAITNIENQPYDLEQLQRDITTRPTRILSQNAKMVKSGDYQERGKDSKRNFNDIVFNIGLPALQGLSYDETKKEFVVVNTCPGAGECKTYCYAMKGGYVQWKNVQMAQTRKLNFLYNDPVGFMTQLSTEIDEENRKSWVKDKDSRVVIRWHDSGDFFSSEYLGLAYALAAKHPNVSFYAYTKRSDVVGAIQNKPPNFTINSSEGAAKAEERRIDVSDPNIKHAPNVDPVLSHDLLKKDGSRFIKDEKNRWQWESPQAWNTFKDRLAAKYSINKETIINYDEMMNTPLGGSHADGARSFARDKFNVVVMPGDGDDAANRQDVKGTFLIRH